MDSVKAAWEAGTGRLRPVIMTATAMIIGMLPMALGLGEGGEQNAPLGRAVIGGLMLATVATVIFVPVVFSLLHRQAASSAKAEPKENVPSTVIPDPKWGELVMADVVLKPGKTLSADELIAYCRRSLANFKIPRRVEFSDTELPKSGSGKILKKVLRERFWIHQERAVS